MRSPLRFGKDRPYDVIVCGAGHAGAEAALAAARRGADVLLLTGNLDSMAQMSCNPAIGGQAKGHMVREIDALGGEMALNADTTAIQFRLLNASKGPAVQAPRAQCDKRTYLLRMKHRIERDPQITPFQAMVTGLIFAGDRVCGVETNLDHSFYGQTVVVTTGTFLRGLMHIGKNQNEGGRIGDFSAKGLSGSFLKAGIELERLKTGTPPRILGSSIDFAQCAEQRGDEQPTAFGFYDTRLGVDLFHVEQAERTGACEALFHVEQTGQRLPGWVPGSIHVSCWQTSTGPQTEKLVNDHLHLSPLYSGGIRGTGPRYCPSIEDKYLKFAGKAEHRLFLEPEGIGTNEWYINGFSTSLPLEVQLDILRSVPGLEHAIMIRPAYAVEYDFAPPTQLHASLESKKLENLFFAGQINGTSGYEEAAAQGLLAGVNAVAKTRGENPLVLGRDEAYIGVLVDDLVTKGTKEPYRMFTSRAEYRLLFNHGSAELRLFEQAERLGLLPPNRRERVRQKCRDVEEWIERLEKHRVFGGRVGELIRKEKPLESLELPKEFHGLSASARAEILYRIRYQGYLEREMRQVEKFRSLAAIKIPWEFDYRDVKGLRNESRQKLVEERPATLAQAERISGVNPADISLLLFHLQAKRPDKASVTSS